ncbi:diaminopimelate decarboxylase [Patescibacteria group bacterium]|nr:diaminopimelate decarboxylase [Patescibacteria group bacterium]
MINTEIFQLIAKKFKTPAYVYEQELLKTQLLTLANAILWRPLTILYAIKANSNFRLVRTLVNQRLPKGVILGVDAVSPGEVDLALRAGVSNQNIIFTGNNVSNEEIDTVYKKGVMVNIDALSHLEKFCRKHSNGRICIRINPNVGAGHHDHCITGGPDSKFGIWYSQAQLAQNIADKYNVHIVGVHQHIGSQILDPDKFLYAMDVLFEIAPIFWDLSFVDFGGGFGVPYSPEEKPLDIQSLGAAMSLIFTNFCEKYDRKLKMVIEPGRYLTAQAGYLLVKVTTVKHNPDGKIFVGGQRV